jgi:hypothetical protein
MHFDHFIVLSLPHIFMRWVDVSYNRNSFVYKQTETTSLYVIALTQAHISARQLIHYSVTAFASLFFLPKLKLSQIINFCLPVLFSALSRKKNFVILHFGLIKSRLCFNVQTQIKKLSFFSVQQIYLPSRLILVVVIFFPVWIYYPKYFEFSRSWNKLELHLFYLRQKLNYFVLLCCAFNYYSLKDSILH